jgi:hypothetical protein
VIDTAMRRYAAVTLGLPTAMAMTVGATASAAPRPALRHTSETSTGFAGYQVGKPKTHLKSASATFVVPKISCKKDLSGVGPAVIFNSAVNKKTNTFRSTAAGVGASCQHKQVVYQSIIEIEGTAYNDISLSEGDVVTITARLAPKVKITVSDTTSGARKTRTGKKFTAVLAQIGCNALDINKAHAGLDPFSKIRATKAKVDGKPLGSLKLSRVTWVHGRHVLVKASKITGRDNFTLTFRSSE